MITLGTMANIYEYGMHWKDIPEPGVWTALIELNGLKMTIYAVEVVKQDGFWVARTREGDDSFWKFRDLANWNPVDDAVVVPLADMKVAMLATIDGFRPSS